MDALGEMDRDGVNQLPVMTGDQILGILGRDECDQLFENLERTQPSLNHP